MLPLPCLIDRRQKFQRLKWTMPFLKLESSSCVYQQTFSLPPPPPPRRLLLLLQDKTLWQCFKSSYRRLPLCSSTSDAAGYPGSVTGWAAPPIWQSWCLGSETIFLKDTYLQPHEMSRRVKLGEVNGLKVPLHFPHEVAFGINTRGRSLRRWYTFPQPQAPVLC